MSNIKKGGLLYVRSKTPKFQAGSVFNPQDFSYNDSSLFKGNEGSSFGQQNAALFGKDKNAFKKTLGTVDMAVPSPAKPSGYNFGPNAPKTFGMKSLVGQGTAQLTAGYVSPVKPKKEATPVTGRASYSTLSEAAAPVVDMAGAALSNTTDSDDTTYTKKEKAGDVTGSALKGATTGLSVATTLATIAPVTTAAVAGSVATAAGLGTAAAGIGTAAAATGVAAGVGGATAVGVGGGTALAGAAAGSVVPIVGTAIGLAIGAIVGLVMTKKAKKKAKAAGRTRDIREESIASAKNRSENASRDTLLTGGPAPTSSVTSGGEGIPGGYLSARNGGSFHFSLRESLSSNRLQLIKPEAPKKLKRGGSIKATENIIPNGVLHEEFNELGDKGMPVVKCKNNTCEKKYEIEKDEMIFTLDTTKTVESLLKGGDLKKLGTFVKQQVLDNTHSFTDKFNDLNTYKNKNESIFT